MVGALSAELWRVIGERQELVAMADAAAIAAASGIDLDRYRATGEIVIDRAQAASLAVKVIAGSSGGADLSSRAAISVADDGSSVTVELKREVPLGLIRVFLLDDQRFVVTGRAVAYPYAPP